MSEQITLTSLSGTELKSLIKDCLKETFQNFDNFLNPQLAKEPKQILSRKEASLYLGISLPTLHSYTQQGLIKAVRIGCSVRYRLTDLQSCLMLINVGGKRA